MKKLLIGMCMLLAACSGGDKIAPQAEAIPTPTAPPSCADVVAEGKPVTKAILDAMCTEPVDGSVHNLPAFVCIGGEQLATVDYSAGHFWGLTGETWHKSAGQSADDPAYGKAYEACHK